MDKHSSKDATAWNRWWLRIFCHYVLFHVSVLSLKSQCMRKRNKKTATYWRAYHPWILQCSKDNCFSTTISVLRRLLFLFTTMVFFFFFVPAYVLAYRQGTDEYMYMYNIFLSVKKKNSYTHGTHQHSHLAIWKLLISRSPSKDILQWKWRLCVDM